MKSNETIESLFTLHLINIFIFVIYFFIKKIENTLNIDIKLFGAEVRLEM